MIFGITGPSGSGKSRVLRLWASHGVIAVEADAVYHELLTSDGEMRSAILSHFPAAAAPDGSVDRTALGRIVFGNQTALSDLERLTHPIVVRTILSDIQNVQGPIAIEAIALFESGMNRFCAATISVTADENVRLTRLVARDGKTEAEVRAQMSAGKPGSWYTGQADFHLDGGGANLEAEALKLLSQLMQI